MTDTVPLKEEGFPEQKTLVIPVRANRAYHYTLYALWIIEVILAFRFLLKLFGANAENIFAKTIYGVSYVLVYPFQTLFGASPSNGERVLEGSTLFAMVVYAIVLWSIAKFILIKESKPSRDA